MPQEYNFIFTTIVVSRFSPKLLILDLIGYLILNYNLLRETKNEKRKYLVEVKHLQLSSILVGKWGIATSWSVTKILKGPEDQIGTKAD